MSSEEDGVQGTNGNWNADTAGMGTCNPNTVLN